MSISWHDPDLEHEYSRVIVHGVELTCIPPKVAERLYGKQEWIDWLSYDINPTHWESKEGKLVTSSRLIKTFKGVPGERWFHAAKKFLTMPNGQVKNFLVACRTFWGGQEKVKVMVKGSRSVSHGGGWHFYYAAHLMHVCKDVEIHFVDPNEQNDEYFFETPTQKVRLVWSSALYEGRGEGFDVLIDDAWEPVSGIVPMQPVSKYYSLKGIEEETDARFVPFLHARETRFFSHTPVDSKSPCSCCVCHTISQVASSFEHYEFLRHACTVLDHNTGCLRTAYDHDLKAKGDLLRSLMKKTTITIQRPVDVRAVMSLVETERITFLEGNTIQASVEAERKHDRFLHNESFGQTAEYQAEVYPWLEGKNVIFCGVNPAVIGTTQTSSITQGHTGGALHHIAFCANIQSAMMTSAAIMYIPGKVEDILRNLPSWRMTGRSVKGFREFAFNEQLAPAVQMARKFSDTLDLPRTRQLRPVVEDIGDVRSDSYYRHNNVVFRSLPLFPWITDFTDHSPLRVFRGYRPAGYPSKKYWSILQMRKGEMQVRDLVGSDLNPSSIIWRNEMEYGFLSPSVYDSSIIRRCAPCYLRTKAFGSYPTMWDSGVEEEWFLMQEGGMKSREKEGNRLSLFKQIGTLLSISKGDVNLSTVADSIGETVSATWDYLLRAHYYVLTGPREGPCNVRFPNGHHVWICNDNRKTENG